MSEENMNNQEGAAPDQPMPRQAVPEQTLAGQPPAADQPVPGQPASEQPAPPAEMRGLKAQLSAAFDSAKANFMQLLIVGVIGVALAWVLGMVWAKLAVNMIMQSPALFMLAPILGTLVMWLPMLLMMSAAFMLITGVSTSAMDAYKGSFRKLPGLILIYALMTLALSGGFVLLLVPGVILSVWFYPVFFIYVKEGVSPVDALVQSREYARGNFKLIFLRLLAVGVISFLLMLLGFFTMVLPVVGPLLYMFLAFFIGVLFFAYSHELYADLSALPGVTRASTLSSRQRSKVMAFPLGCAALGLILMGFSVFQQVSAVQDSPMRDMMALAANAENMSEEEMQAGMQAMMAAQLEQAAQSGDLPPEMREMMEQMAGGAKEEAKPAAKKPEPPAMEKPAAEAAKPAGEKRTELTPEQKAAAQAFLNAVNECLADKDWVVRRDAVAAIGYLHLKEFVPQLNRMTRDSNAFVRSEASKSLLKVRYGK